MTSSGKTKTRSVKPWKPTVVKEELFFSFLLVTDINSHDSLLVVSANDELKASINYPQRGQSNIYELSGIVSRKKQLIPYISSLLKTMGVV
ncbi:MAG: DHHA2 domain-containing protein [Coraliomargaritaceae bacterium]